MRNFLGAGNNTNLVQCANLRTQPTVHAEHLAVYNGG